MVAGLAMAVICICIDIVIHWHTNPPSPTRSLSHTIYLFIIDTMFCSELCRNKMCGIVLSDATDHMPIFVRCDNTTYVSNNNDPKVRYNRTLDGDALSKFEQD